MRWCERQHEIESKVHESVDEISDEIGLDVPSYPEVFWTGKTIYFEDTGLPDYLWEEFENRKKSKASYFIPKFKVIILNDYRTHEIAEESAHFFHFSVSGIDNKRPNITKNSICLEILIEMLGFFGAKIAGSEVTSGYTKWPDLSRLDKKNQNEFRKNLERRYGRDFDFEELFIHQQGYGLGERLYYDYIHGKISIVEIRKLFLSRFDGKNEASNKFAELKERLWTAN
ncbi:hypothetical protein HYW74_01110 [Candidatus Pacearchaeota archaeon]|nr:hypothetical protein [Candidatus Pacearchaeota archaeon]